jgi:type VI secretion system protein ImpG
VRLKLDAEQPRLIAQLLESIYPNFLAPVPSMLVARLAVDTADPNLAHGYRVPRGTAVHSTLPRGQDTLCEFSTAHEVTLWPVEITAVQYFSSAPDLNLNRLPPARATRGGLRIKLRAGGGLSFSQLRLDRLAFYLSAPDDVAFRLHELVLGTVLGSHVHDGTPADTASRWRDAQSVQPLGLESDQALLPEHQRSFSGHRLLQEVSALPQRLLFFEVTDLAARLASVAGSEVELVLLFGRADAGLEPLVDAQSLALFCTPAINLFRKRLDRIMLGSGSWEHHAVPDRTRPMDYEVHSLIDVQGHSAGPEGTVAFKPLYSSSFEGGPSASHYTFRRDPRRPTDKQCQHGSRVPSYLGEEVFISLADGQHGAHRESLRQLSISAWVTNRDLPVLLPQGAGGGDKAWRLDTPGPVSAVHCLRGPTRPVSRQPGGRAGWQLVAQVARHQIPLGDDPAANAAALRELLTLHGPPGDVAWTHQAEGLRSLTAKPVVRRLPFKGPLSFGNGVELVLEVDEHAFQGASAFLLGSAIEALLARQAAINSFTQLTLVSAQRGLVMRWPPRIGQRPLL